MSTPKSLLRAGIAAAILTAVLTIMLLPSLHWRAQVCWMKLSGQLPQIRMSDLMSMLAPTSDIALARLIDTRNPYSVIKNPRTSDADTRSGRQMFAQRCASCHGDGGQGGGVGPSLRQVALKHGRSDWAIYSVIRDGVASTSMPAHDYPAESVWRLVAYVQSLPTETGSPAVAPAAGDGPAFAPLPYAELAAAQVTGDDWLTYSGTYSGQRHSRLGQINPDNVALLRPAWLFQVNRTDGMKVDCTPLVRRGRMFITSPSGSAYALDAASGRLIWRHDRRPPTAGPAWSGALNRGAAMLDDRLFVGTGDGKLIALSADTGAVQWIVDAADPRDARQVTSAPLAINGMVVVGTGGANGRASIAAFDSKTGRERWRFFTIPAPGEPHADSWAGMSARNGGAAAWMTGSYDPESDLVYWGVGNPAPDYNAQDRAGDNLYSNSIVALRGATGQLMWHFQFTPGDDHDWDAAQVPVLAMPDWPGEVPAQLLLPNRNGFFYRLDRRNGGFIQAVPFVRQNWARAISASGRPARLAPADPEGRGILTWPSNVGATNWWPPSFDPALGYLFVPAIERGQVFFPAGPGQDPGPRNFPSVTGRPHQTRIKALDARTGNTLWEHTFGPRLDKAATGGLLSTASGLVFGGDLDRIVALRSTTGEKLWEYNAGGQVTAAPITYGVNGKQYFAVVAGSVFMAFTLPENSGTANRVATAPLSPQRGN